MKSNKQRSHKMKIQKKNRQKYRKKETMKQRMSKKKKKGRCHPKVKSLLQLTH